MSSFRLMIAALAIDNFGSGLFLPLALIYLTRVVGIATGAAGTALAVGTGVGVVMPLLAAKYIDRVGPRRIVIAAQLMQGLGMVMYLFAQGLLAAFVGSILTGAGLQLFYAGLGSMTAELADGQSKDHAFALVGAVRSATFALGALAGGMALSLPDRGFLRVVVGTNATTFVLAVLLLALVRHRFIPVAAESGRSRFPLRDRKFLALLALTFLISLGTDLVSVVMPIYVTDYVHAAGWTVGASVALSTAVSALAATWVVRRTARLRRTTSIAIAVTLLLAWTFGMAALLLARGAGAVVGLLVLTVVAVVATLLASPRIFAIVGDIAPKSDSGAYFAFLQYGFTIAQTIAPLFAALLTVRPELPWLVYAALLGVSALLVRAMSQRFPDRALDPTPAAVKSR
jgi:MFS family permease